MSITQRQKDTMYRIGDKPIKIQDIHTTTLASLVARGWVELRGKNVRVTSFGAKAFDIEVQRDYQSWVNTLRDVSKYKRSIKK